MPEPTLHVAAYPEENGVLAHVRIQPPEAEKRFAGDICVIIDVSGSMQMEATVKDQEAGAPVLSILDVVRHAVKTAIHTMESTDRICIVSYSDYASKVLDLTFMDAAGKAAAEEALGNLRAGGQTNLWDGLQTGLDMLRAGMRGGAASSALLLTDGVPDEPGPPGGYLAALARYRAKQGNTLPCTLHTFGFGYELDSALLDGLASAGGGLYVFIPDAGFVGTALVNCTSNALTAAGRNAKLLIQVEDGVTCKQVFGYSAPPSSAAGCCVPLGSIQLGQSKDLMLRLECTAESGGCTPGRPLISVKLSYDGPDSAQKQTEAEVVLSEGRMPGDAQVQLLRLQLVETIGEMLRKGGAGDLPGASHAVKSFIEKAKKAAASLSDPHLAALCEDSTGQVSESTSREDWYKTWGSHYLRSLSRAHLSQQCNNFKDPGVQDYGGELFRDVRDVADDMFVKLPAPKPENVGAKEMLMAMGFLEADVKRALDYAYDDAEQAATYLMEGMPARRPPPQATGNRAGAPAAAPVRHVDMSAYYDRSGG
eukprot:TRINITY_DN19352_c0_g2_i1.p1 TRINITY_DN19352_c0_g2~~TRINITY_DN19352_c0_g2_i1.p1  ORF type:complete len:537 (+),score=109.95 TRINITY_DN19352_c0_g2_i1:75-1685(+)